MTKKKKTLRAAILASIFAMSVCGSAWAAGTVDVDGYGQSEIDSVLSNGKSGILYDAGWYAPDGNFYYYKDGTTHKIDLTGYTSSTAKINRVRELLGNSLVADGLDHNQQADSISDTTAVPSYMGYFNTNGFNAQSVSDMLADNLQFNSDLVRTVVEWEEADRKATDKYLNDRINKIKVTQETGSNSFTFYDGSGTSTTITFNDTNTDTNNYVTGINHSQVSGDGKFTTTISRSGLDSITSNEIDISDYVSNTSQSIVNQTLENTEFVKSITINGDVITINNNSGNTQAYTDKHITDFSQNIVKYGDEYAGTITSTIETNFGDNIVRTVDISGYVSDAIKNEAGDANYYKTVINEDGSVTKIKTDLTINQAITQAKTTVSDDSKNMVVTVTTNEDGSTNYKVAIKDDVTFNSVTTNTLNAAEANIGAAKVGELEAVKANIGTAEIGELKAVNADIDVANIRKLTALEANVQRLDADTINAITANVQRVNTDTLYAVTGNIQRVNTDTLYAVTGNIQRANIDTLYALSGNVQTLYSDTANILTANIQTTNTEVVNLGTAEGGTDIRYDVAKDRITYNGGTEQVANLNDGYYYTGDITTKVNGENPYADLTGKTINVAGGATNLVTTTKNIGVTTTQTDTGIDMNLQLAKDIGGFESVSVPGKDGKDGVDGTTITNEGIVITGPQGDPGKDGKDGTVTVKHDEVNVGGNRIEGVADGVNPTDAVNVRQLNKLSGRVDKVGAGAAALAALHPLDFDPDDKLSFSAGVGNYGGETATALGAFYRPTEKVMFSAAGTMGNGENMVNMGVTFALDKTNNVSNSRVAMAREIQDLREQVAALTALVTQLAGRSNPALMDTVMFPDVPENHWAYDYIDGLQKRGIIEGYPDGNFGGDRSMTRYEYAAMLYRALEKGFPVDSRLLDEFDAELGRIRIDRIKGEDSDPNKTERVRVNNYQDRDDYGSKLVTVAAAK